VRKLAKLVQGRPIPCFGRSLLLNTEQFIERDPERLPDCPQSVERRVDEHAALEIREVRDRDATRERNVTERLPSIGASASQARAEV
jgi:hypothetical protein